MNTRNEIAEGLLQITGRFIRQGTLSPDELNLDLGELGMDSMGFVAVILAAEEMFSVEIPSEYLLLSKLNTIQKMADVIAGLK